MKRLLTAFILGLFVFTASAMSFAGGGYITGGTPVALILAGVFDTGSSAAPDKAQIAVPTNEFAALSNNPQYDSLLKQTAGGKLNTLDILK